RKLLRLASDGLFTFSDAPLRLATWLGVFTVVGSLGVGGCLALWQSSALLAIAAGIFFLGGVQLGCLGILGEYIGRIHTEVQCRPAFVVEELVGFGHETPGRSAELASTEVLAGAPG